MAATYGEYQCEDIESSLMHGEDFLEVRDILAGWPPEMLPEQHVTPDEALEVYWERVRHIYLSHAGRVLNTGGIP
jgi:hypothetical protein